MARILFTAPDGTSSWFDPDKAEIFHSDTRWNGNAVVSQVTGSEWIDEYLYLTPSGRWILNNDASRYHNGDDSYRDITADEARDWMLRAGVADSVIEQHFGEIEEERGPGRTPIGKPMPVRIPNELREVYKAAASRLNVPEAELVRRAMEAYRPQIEQ